MSVFNKLNMGLQTDRYQKCMISASISRRVLWILVVFVVFMGVESGPAACFQENAEKL